MTMYDQDAPYVSKYRGHTISVSRFLSGYGDWQWDYRVDDQDTGGGTADLKRDALRWAREFVDEIIETGKEWPKA